MKVHSTVSSGSRLIVATPLTSVLAVPVPSESVQRPVVLYSASGVSVTVRTPGSTFVNVTIIGSVLSLSSSSENGDVSFGMSCVNSKSVESSGTVFLIILIVPFFTVLMKVHSTVSSGSRLIVAMPFVMLLAVPVPSESVQLPVVM